MTQHVHLTISGRVQGVGFRWFVKTEAERFRVAGMVRNRSDGAVEVHAEGPRETLEPFVRRVGAGPPGAQVLDVTESWAQAPSRHRGFHIAF